MTNRPRPLYLLGALLATAFACAAQTRSASPYSLHIEPKQKVFTAGKDVVVLVSLTNVSPRTLPTMSGCPGVDFAPDVRAIGAPPAGQPHKWDYGVDCNLHDLLPLAPAKSIKDEFNVSWFYDLAKPRAYSISLSFAYAATASGAKILSVNSNPITITVMPAPAK